MSLRPPNLSGMPVLVVEDDVLQALDLAASLREAGAIPIGPAATSEEALSLTNLVEFGAVVLDLRLRNEDGTWLAWEFYRQRVPFVVHTGYMETRFLPTHWPGCQIMFKPANIDKLVRTLSHLVRWKRMVSRSGSVESPAETVLPAAHLHIVRSARATG